MSRAKTVIVIGAGGHARVLLDALAASGVAVAGLTDADPAKHGKMIAGARVLGDDRALDGHPPDSTMLVNAMGSTESMQQRQAVYERLKERGYRFLTLTHPAAVIARDAVLQEGAQVMAGAIVQSGARIGANSIVNTGAVVDHDSDLGEHVHIAPGATLSGNVRIGAATHIGTGASIIQNINIGRNCLVAAGAAVTKDVPDGACVAGVPARSMKP